MPQKQASPALRRRAAALLVLPLLWLSFTLLAPFVRGLLLAAVSLPLVRRIGLRAPGLNRVRGPAAVLAVFATAAAAILALRGLAAAALNAQAELAPLLTDAVRQAADGLLSERLQGTLLQTADGLFRALAALLRALLSATEDSAADVLLTLLTALLLSAQPEPWCARLRALLPPALRRRCAAVGQAVACSLRRFLRRALPRFLGAAALGFAALLPFLGGSAWLPALAIGAAEATCVAGLLLLPAAFCAARLSQQPPLFTLLGLYALFLLLRIRFAEPRRKPAASRLLLTLAAGYAGYRICGMTGALLLPLLAAAGSAIVRVSRRAPVS